MAENERIRSLNGRSGGEGDIVLYWMRSAVRTGDNPSLTLAREEAARRGLPLVVFFAFRPDYPRATARSFAFVLEGVWEAFSSLEEAGIPCFAFRGTGCEILPLWGGAPALVVLDRCIEPSARRDAEEASRALDCPCLEVDADSALPLDLVSCKREWSAATLRPKLMPLLLRYGLPGARFRGPVPAWQGSLPRALEERLVELSAFASDSPDGARAAFFSRYNIDASVGPVGSRRGGEGHARARLRAFLESGLGGYAAEGRRPGDGIGSGLSPWLHAGHISARTVIEAVTVRPGPDADAFVEQIAVRRDLARNFCWRCPSCDSWEGLPDWAARSLLAHRDDRRAYRYAEADWEGASTHDRIWNAAQRQLREEGVLGNRLRMYWGKRILEWSADPVEALRIAVTLNDRWALDGRDPNGWAGILWCFGLHDRPFAERAVFGMVRPLGEAALRRRMDVDAYVKLWEAP